MIGIRAEGLGKKYRIAEVEERELDTLRDVLARKTRRWLRRMGAPLQGVVPARGEDSIWALREVSFEVPRGQVLGIIGPNGAGKSTLFKLLSRITEPTVGEVSIRGRVGALLEVGTGFHSELSGRENIYLSGAILGMTRREIDRKFEEIVRFAGVRKFLDTPVKHYSSGMYLRLAFAVAAHLEPDILLVDEVLSVGDAEFQRKCLGKMDDVASSGRTVVFISHNMNAVRRLCDRCLLVRSGRIVADGDPRAVVAEYLEESIPRVRPGRWIELASASHSGSGEARFEAVRYAGGDLGAPSRPHRDGSLQVDVRVRAPTSRSVSSLALMLFEGGGLKLVNADVLALGRTLSLRRGVNVFRFTIPRLHLEVGHYTLGLWLADPPERAIDHVEAALTLEVVSRDGTDVRRREVGAVVCDFEFETLAGDGSSAP